MSNTLRHRTLYGRIRDGITEACETIKIQCRRGNGPMDGKRIDQRVLEHFDRYDDQDIEAQARELLSQADDGAGRMARRIELNRGQWWHQLLRAMDDAGKPDIADIDEWRRHTTICAFRLERTVSTLLVRASLDMRGNREECEEACRKPGWVQKAGVISRTAADYDIMGLAWSHGSDFSIAADTVQIRRTPPASYVASLPGKQLEELIDTPFIRDSGIRILAAQQMNDILFVETDAHDEPNTVSFIDDPEGKLAT